MKTISVLEKIKPLLKKPSFTSKDALQYGVSAAALAYYIKRKEVIRIGHGIYCGIQATKPEDFRLEGIVEALQRVKEGVVCLVSALIIYELTDEMPSQYWIAIRHETVHKPGPNTKVVRMRNFDLGRTTLKLGKIILPIFDRERTIIDAFRYLSRETALKALKRGLTKRGKEKLDIEKMRAYGKKLKVNIDPYLLVLTNDE